MIIGIVGSIASGKGIVSGAFEKKGFVKLVFSDLLREELPKHGIEINRKNMQDFANNWRQQYGGGYLAERLLEKIELDKNYVLEGVRNPGEIFALKKSAHKVVIVGIDAPLDKRFQWIMMRNRENDPHTIDDVKKADDRDSGVGEPEWGQQVKKSFEMADMIIHNDGDRKKLNKNIDKLLKKLKIA